jgi:hypothetical protein
MDLLGKRRFWPPRFGLRALLLFVLVIAVALAFWDGWRRRQNARNARAEFQRHNYSYNLGVIRPDVIIEASQNLLAAERRQWFSSFFDRALVDSNILRLTRIRDKWRHAVDHFYYGSEESWKADLQRVEQLSRLIDEMETQNRQGLNETEEE